VMQAIERARSLIIAQAYMQKRVGDVGRPTEAEIEDYFNKHPQFFANRRQFAMNQLVFPAASVTPELRAAADKARSLEEVAAYLDTRKVAYGRAQVTRSTADLKPELAAKLLSMPKGQLFLVQEGQRALLTSIDEVRDAPVSLAIAAPQIAQYLANRKNKELAQAEIQRLRATARIDYLNKDLAPDAATPGALPAAAPASLAGAGLETGATAHDGNGDNDIGPVADTVDEDARADKAALDRGVAGLE
jgi:peptidyl-prolyl cis-trans isomerase C